MHPRDSGVAAELSPQTPRDRARAELAALLAHVGIASAELDARLLVQAACGIDHAGLIRDPATPLGQAAANTLSSLGVRRMSGEPVSRILGRREFWGLQFAIGPGVLDPRPDTEGVVGAVLDAVGGRRDAPLRILDLGTGSGAILCALLHELPGACGVGIDRSLAACRVARANAAALGLGARAAIVCGSWSDAIAARYDIVVANPPYIPSGDIACLAREVREHDPIRALDGGTDGLEAYRAIVPRLAVLLAMGGVAALECGWDQGRMVAELLATGLVETRVLKDLAGHDRVVIGQAA